MPTLRALLVGINQYPNPNHALRGCVNDVRDINRYLEAYCAKMGFTYRPSTLLDASATRQAVINGFDHFLAAEPEDCCLFHFSGHGSRSAAPKAFWGIEPDHTLESIVCWDSRQPGGHDLMDKELSYLVWRTSKGDIPFVTILDCCHSGRMRALEDEEIGLRTLRDAGNMLPETRFLGLEHYKKTENGQLSPPLGRRVHLGASRDTEQAKEVIAGGLPRGVFTYCLTEALDNSGSLISYADLLNRVNLRIRNVVAHQSAQMDTTFSEDRNRGFLFSRIDADRPSYLVAWQKESGSWALNAGAMQGIPAGDDGSRTVLELTDDGHRVYIENVLPDRSTISGMEGYDTRRAYSAVIRHRARPKLDIAFAPGSDPDGVSILKTLIQSRASDLFQLHDSVLAFSYRIHARDGAYFLSRRHDSRPLFQREFGYTEASAGSFLRKLDKVANWQQVLELNNPDSGIRDSEIGLDLYRVIEPGDHSDDAPAELVDWPGGAVVYQYGAPDLKPAFQLKLRNTGLRPLWVGLLYLASDFSIDNQLLPKVQLAPGEEIWAMDIHQGQSYRTIPLLIHPDQLRQGINLIEEFIKVLISTEELNTDFYYQEGLAADTGPGSLRGKGRGDEPEMRDWTTKTVCLHIKLEKPPGGA